MPAPLPILISEGFGTGDASKTYPIPVPSQIGITPGAASFTDGFPPLTRTAIGAGGIPPDGEDVNGILYMATAHLALVCSGQPYRYDAGQATAIGGYDKGALLLNAAGDGFWLNTLAGNTSNPDTGGGFWVPAYGYGETSVALTTGTATLTAAQVGKRVIVLTGTITGPISLQFPGGVAGDWIVANDTSGAFAVNAKVAGGTNVVSIPQGGPNAPTIVYSNGVDLYNANVSTAGLAPLNSPALTGVPTAPTAAATSNTTQIATTAQVHAAILAAIAGLAPLASPTFTGVPTTPTPPPGNSSARIASTAFVQNAIASGPVIKKGTFTAVNGVVSVAFGFTFASAPEVFVQWYYTAPDVGYIVPGSITTTGFQYQTGNTGVCNWLAVL